MNNLLSITGVVLVIFALSSCALEQEKAAPPAKPAAPAVAEAKKAPPVEKAPAAKAPEVKAEVIKAGGDGGVLDLEKNYLILVTKEGKLITADFNNKTKVTKLVPQPAKMADINLGQSATVTYTSKGDKKIAQSVEYDLKAKKGE